MSRRKRPAELTSKPYNVLGGTLNSAQSNQSFAVESIVVTKLLFRVNAWLIMRNPLNRLYKHTMRLVLYVCLLIGSGDGSTLIICRRGQAGLRPSCRFQLAVMHVLEKSGTSTTSVSINSMAGRPSGWALPRILVIVDIQYFIHSSIFLCVCAFNLFVTWKTKSMPRQLALTGMTVCCF